MVSGKIYRIKISKNSFRSPCECFTYGISLSDSLYSLSNDIKNFELDRIKRMKNIVEEYNIKTGSNEYHEIYTDMKSEEDERNLVALEEINDEIDDYNILCKTNIQIVHDILNAKHGIEINNIGLIIDSLKTIIKKIKDTKKICGSSSREYIPF